MLSRRRFLGTVSASVLLAPLAETGESTLAHVVTLMREGSALSRLRVNAVTVAQRPGDGDDDVPRDGYHRVAATGGEGDGGARVKRSA
jgi:hypothetical protein